MVWVCFDPWATMRAWNQSGEFPSGGRGICFFFLVCGWLALTIQPELQCYLRSVLDLWPLGVIIWLGSTNLLFCFLLHILCRVKKRRVGASFRRNQKSLRSQKIQEKWQSPKCSISLVRKSGKLADVMCLLWAESKLGAALLRAGWRSAVKHGVSSPFSFTLFFIIST